MKELPTVDHIMHDKLRPYKKPTFFPDKEDLYSLKGFRCCDLPFITNKTKIASMGSCFARAIGIYFWKRDYDYILTEKPIGQANGSAMWRQIYNTACLRQVFEYTFSNWQPIVRWWDTGSTMIDPFREHVSYPKSSYKENFEWHRQNSHHALSNAEVLIFTVGMIETWRDKRDGSTFSLIPRTPFFDSSIHEFYLRTVEDCYADLCVVYSILKKVNPTVKIITTVSPVPFIATFRSDLDSVAANMLSKATLRVAVDLFCRDFDDVFYFPAYEVVMQGTPDPFTEDGRHVSQKSVKKVVSVFLDNFIKGE
jgi:hypothetical protein